VFVSLYRCTVFFPFLRLIYNCKQNELAFTLKLAYFNKYWPSHKYIYVYVYRSQIRRGLHFRISAKTTMCTPNPYHFSPIAYTIANNGHYNHYHYYCVHAVLVPTTFSVHIIILYLPIIPIHIYKLAHTTHIIVCLLLFVFCFVFLTLFTIEARSCAREII
jgi:hypothetical protein